jgi:hypothetical protein
MTRSLDKKTLIIIAEALVIIALSILLWKGCGSGRTGTVLPSDDAAKPKHAVATSAPVRALDKAAVKDAVPKGVVQNPQAEVLATGKVVDDSGSRTIAAVLDTETGDTALVQKRPLFEWMSASELGLGYGWGDDGEEKAVRVEHTFARIGGVYASAEGRIQTNDEETRWSAMLWLNYRW